MFPLNKQTTSVIVRCPGDNCPGWVELEYVPGYPDTFWEPGQPDWWEFVAHRNGNPLCAVTNDEAPQTVYDNLQDVAGKVAQTSWDNIYGAYSDVYLD